MHPMFRELFIETDAEDVVSEEDWRAACAGLSDPDRPWSIRNRA